MLSREDFTRERIDRIAAEAERAGLPTLSHAEREADRRRTLASSGGGDVWIFGYGSLMWNPAFRYRQSCPARLYGLHRRFCLWLPLGRGTPELPGLMLGLDRGGSCEGLAFRIEAHRVDEETEILWMREMIAATYRARWIRLRGPDGPFRALTFVVNRGHPRYCAPLPVERTVHHLANAVGWAGSCREYLARTVEHLRAAALADHAMESLHRAVEAMPLPSAAPAATSAP